MKQVILLDSGPLGALANPRATPETLRSRRRLAELFRQGYRVLVPEIADYEVRREILRLGRGASLRRLDRLKAEMGYLALTTEVMLQAAAFWADARRRGQPTAHPHALDGDVILAAQAHVLARDGHAVIVATTNVDHLARFVDARPWEAIA